ncbi:MAG TPA: hypothetical protein DIW17_06185 [Clostridiales bacterium]|nr:hypothetical protein [Clostridiales bacterium]
MSSAFCTECGSGLEMGAKFCDNCGASVLPSQAAQPQTQSQPQPQPVKPIQSQPAAVEPAAYQSQQQYTAPAQTAAKAASNETLGVFGYILTMLGLSIPIVGIILVFVWAFGANTNLARKNFSRAVLILGVIGIVFAIALASTIQSILVPLFMEFSEGM